MGYHVFISHASEDKDRLVRLLVEKLYQRQIHCYDDASLKNLLPGEKRAAMALREAQDAHLSLVVLSPCFIAKSWLGKELQTLLTNTKRTEQRTTLLLYYKVSPHDCQDIAKALRINAKEGPLAPGPESEVRKESRKSLQSEWIQALDRWKHLSSADQGHWQELLSQAQNYEGLVFCPTDVSGYVDRVVDEVEKHFLVINHPAKPNPGSTHLDSLDDAPADDHSLLREEKQDAQVANPAAACAVSEVHKESHGAFMKVCLYNKTAMASTLFMHDPLQPGMEFVAYFSEEDNSEELHAGIESRLKEFSSELLVEYRSHCSTFIYITVIQASKDDTLADILHALGKATIVTLKWINDSNFELTDEGGRLAYFKLKQAPTLCRVFYAAMTSGKDNSDFLVVHGNHLLCDADVSLYWRLGPYGDLIKIVPIHPDILAAQNALGLLDRLMDSIAIVPPALQTCSSDTIYLEAWRGFKSIGNAVKIPVSDLLLGLPLREGEQQMIEQQIGVSDWKTAANSYAAPSAHNWDVFISHAGDNADKPFARALKQLLERTGWGLRIFLDDESLLQSTDPEHSMQAAMKSTQLAVLLFSAEFFQRRATKDELEFLLQRHAHHRVQLLPVFLHLTVDECTKEIARLFQPGWFPNFFRQDHVKLPTGVRHKKEPSTLRRGLDKMERETLWHITHGISILLHKEFSTGVTNYRIANIAA